MTATKDQLVKLFSDGMLPTGNDFSELIRSTVHVQTFDAHVREFKAYTTRPEIPIGAPPDRWTLKVTDPTDGCSAALMPVLSNDTPYVELAPQEHSHAGAAGLNIWGYTGLSGRIGTAVGGEAYEGSEPEMAKLAMHSLKAGETHKRIILQPGRPCAFEISAVIDGPQNEHNGWLMRAFHTLIGWKSPVPNMIHAVVVSSGPNAAPSVQVTQSPRVGPAYWRLLLRAFAIVFLAALAIHFLPKWISPDASSQNGVAVTTSSPQPPSSQPAQNTEANPPGDTSQPELEQEITSLLAKVFHQLGLDKIVETLEKIPKLADWIAGVALVLLLCFALSALRLRRLQARLSWRKAEGAGFKRNPPRDLCLQRPKLKAYANTPFNYAITRLWD
ncbi:hypothetical protein [uncultured Ruegeria sp.]|uniref:hypothetical protein n=1 Tax=uncultured Ruegeria sp. TaxID=259304 RepID=UPI002630B735|nr:hypothetical protein [uncultured Ruegeria sp.]